MVQPALYWCKGTEKRYVLYTNHIGYSLIHGISISGHVHACVVIIIFMRLIAKCLTIYTHQYMNCCSNHNVI